MFSEEVQMTCWAASSCRRTEGQNQEAMKTTWSAMELGTLEETSWEQHELEVKNGRRRIEKTASDTVVATSVRVRWQIDAQAKEVRGQCWSCTVCPPFYLLMFKTVAS